jgi:hypothetical protein
LDKTGRNLIKKAEAEGKPYYQYCLHNDVVHLLEPLWRKRGWRWKVVDGKPILFFPLDQQMAPHVPWHYVKVEMDCFMWTEVLFESVTKQIDKTFVPAFCHECYKVVARPRTLKELFALEALQLRMGRHSKCGIEVRDYVPALYGGYWYNRGLEAGVECRDAVRAEVTTDPELGPDVDVYLKRACTEFERAMGRSDLWPPPGDGQLDLENLIKDTVEHTPYLEHQPEAFVLHTHRNWIEWASQNGDETYLEYTGGNPIKGSAVKYNDQPTKEETDG